MDEQNKDQEQNTSLYNEVNPKTEGESQPEEAIVESEPQETSQVEAQSESQHYGFAQKYEDPNQNYQNQHSCQSQNDDQNQYYNYNQSNYGYHAGNEPYPGSDDQMDTSPLTLGDWLLTILASFIPCCGGVILYLYWAFSKKGNVNRRNYCRAALIIQIAVQVLLVAFFVFLSMVGIYRRM